jgi:hypothetical protein
MSPHGPVLLHLGEQHTHPSNMPYIFSISAYRRNDNIKDNSRYFLLYEPSRSNENIHGQGWSNPFARMNERESSLYSEEEREQFL